jgi:Uma2 family endonuclease
MPAVPNRPTTLAEFLAWEELQPVRHEFDGARPVAMAGGTLAHAAIQRNLAVALGSRLRGQKCQFYGSDLKIEAAGRIRYPDGFVLCAPLPPGTTVVSNPVVVFEVLSAGTASTDIVTKNNEYAATPSVRRYVILAQDRIGCAMFERLGEDWDGHILGPDTVLKMPEIGIDLPLTEFYADVDLAEPEPGA